MVNQSTKTNSSYSIETSFNRKKNYIRRQYTTIKYANLCPSDSSTDVDISLSLTMMVGYGSFGIRLAQTIDGGFLTYFFIGADSSTNFGAALYLILCKNIQDVIYSGIISNDPIYTKITNSPTYNPTETTLSPTAINPTPNPSIAPSLSPALPSNAPSTTPTGDPTGSPTVSNPTGIPSKAPHDGTIDITREPTEHPTVDDSIDSGESIVLSEVVYIDNEFQCAKSGNYSVLIGFRSVNGITSGSELSSSDIRSYYYVRADRLNDSYFTVDYVWIGSVEGDFEGLSNTVNIFGFDIGYIIYCNNNEKFVHSGSVYFYGSDFDIETDNSSYYRGLTKQLVEYHAQCTLVNVWTGIRSKFTYCNLGVWTENPTSVSFELVAAFWNNNMTESCNVTQYTDSIDRKLIVDYMVICSGG